MKKFSIFVLAVVMLLALALPAFAQGNGPKAGFGNLYYDGEVVRTVVPPAQMKQEGRDNIYPIEGGVEDQLPVAAVAPGDTDYHGGKWAVHVVTWNTTPYLLTSEAEVLAAETAGDVTITRVPEADFKCPIQP